MRSELLTHFGLLKENGMIREKYQRTLQFFSALWEVLKAATTDEQINASFDTLAFSSFSKRDDYEDSEDNYSDDGDGSSSALEEKKEEHETSRLEPEIEEQPGTSEKPGTSKSLFPKDPFSKDPVYEDEKETVFKETITFSKDDSAGKSQSPKEHSETSSTDLTDFKDAEPEDQTDEISEVAESAKSSKPVDTDARNKEFTQRQLITENLIFMSQQIDGHANYNEFAEKSAVFLGRVELKIAREFSSNPFVLSTLMIVRREYDTKVSWKKFLKLLKASEIVHYINTLQQLKGVPMNDILTEIKVNAEKSTIHSMKTKYISTMPLKISNVIKDWRV